MRNKKVWVDGEFHKMLKKKAADEDTTILGYTRKAAKKAKKDIGDFDDDFDLF